MRMLLIAASACLALAGCQTASIDEAIQRNLPQICSAATTAHDAFTAVAITGAVSASTVRREEAAWNALQPLCTNPAGATSASVLVAAAAAYATITVALRDADH